MLREKKKRDKEDKKDTIDDDINIEELIVPMEMGNMMIVGEDKGN